MDKYYYLAARLPYLKFDERPLITKDDFVREIEKWASSKEVSEVLKADINNLSGEGCREEISIRYKKFELLLRRELASFREARRAGDKGYSGRLIPLSVFEGNPLDVEKKLLFIRWKYLEDMENSHYFDLGFLVLYFLKLQVLNRLFVFDKKKGLSEFNALCEVK